jgi:hypothetical protein
MKAQNTGCPIDYPIWGGNTGGDWNQKFNICFVSMNDMNRYNYTNGIVMNPAVVAEKSRNSRT